MFTYRLYRPALSHLSAFALLKMRANRELLNYLKTCTHTYTHIYIYIKFYRKFHHLYYSFYVTLIFLKDLYIF